MKHEHDDAKLRTEGGGSGRSADGASSALPQSLADQSRAFTDAAQAIDCGAGGGASEGAPFGGEIGNVAEWAARHSRLIEDETLDVLEVVSCSTSEHKVFFRGLDRRAVKCTWPGVYGQIPVPNQGKLDRRNARPSEYLQRMSLQIEVFGSDLLLEGVNISDKPSMVLFQPAGQPSFVISQPWYDKRGVASNERIQSFLTEEGFKEVPGSYFGWFRAEDGVVIVDAKPDNFIQTEAGLVPIDLQMAVFSEQEVMDAGLHSMNEAGHLPRIICLNSLPALHPSSVSIRPDTVHGAVAKRTLE